MKNKIVKIQNIVNTNIYKAYNSYILVGGLMP